MNDVLLSEDRDGVRTLTLNRPDARNALDADLLTALSEALLEADADAHVGCVVLTGVDPAFSAGLDLKAIAEGRLDVASLDDPEDSVWYVLMRLGTPTIAAVNGPAITGGLELVLACDFAIASERASFADTHARVGIHPGGGLTWQLPAAIGIRAAREMSFTGNFVDAHQALRIGLVNHVVAHDDLASTAQTLAADIAGNDGAAVAAIRETYEAVVGMTVEEGLAVERERFRAWRTDPGDVAARRQAVTERGRGQAAGPRA